ncbi:uncharacterized protein VTP21DRAFT_10394 [Calcarisporiella thermophila]|uniref:uncharacterized protein n=1 Tax=Calcarisporiella thermophila TaxID=911321 RepID=UPI00374217B6
MAASQTQPKQLPPFVANLQAKLNECYKQLDVELEKSAFLKDVEKKTNINKRHLVTGAAAVAGIFIFFNIAGALISNLIGYIYPAYRSFKAIESKDSADDIQWLTYWTVFGVCSIIEQFTDTILYWLPFYFLFKTIFVLWLILPQFRGANVLYTRFLRKFFLENESRIDNELNKLRRSADQALSGEKGEKDN